MKIRLDENLADDRLIAVLRKDGHSVSSPADAGLIGASDARHLAHAIQQGFLILTQDRRDFRDLHDLVLASGGSHPGILLVYSENDPTRNMTVRGIATAIRKLEAANLPLTNQLHVLNQWR